MTLFEVVYGFNVLTPLDLLPLPNTDVMTNKDGFAKTTFVKNLHNDVKDYIKRKMENLATKVNQGRKKITFASSD